MRLAVTSGVPGPHRQALFTLVEAIELEAASAEHSVVEAVDYLRALRGSKAGAPVEVAFTGCGLLLTVVAVRRVRSNPGRLRGAKPR